MAILSTIVKDFIRQKTESGYITLKPKTDADCVSYINSDAVETDVQTELDELNSNLITGSYLNSETSSNISIAPSNIQTLLTKTFTLDKPTLVFIQARITYSSVTYDEGQRQLRLKINDNDELVWHMHTIKNINNYVRGSAVASLPIGSNTIKLSAYFSSTTGNNVNVSGHITIYPLRYV